MEPEINSKAIFDSDGDLNFNEVEEQKQFYNNYF